MIKLTVSQLGGQTCDPVHVRVCFLPALGAKLSNAKRSSYAVYTDDESVSHSDASSPSGASPNQAELEWEPEEENATQVRVEAGQTVDDQPEDSSVSDMEFSDAVADDSIRVRYSKALDSPSELEDNPHQESAHPHERPSSPLSSLPASPARGEGSDLHDAGHSDEDRGILDFPVASVSE